VLNRHTRAEQDLELIAEAKIRVLLGNPPEQRFEASGVCVREDACHVIFDNASHVARFGLEGSRLSSDSRLTPLHSPFSGYEDICYDPRARRFFMLIEAQKSASGLYLARIEEYDQELNFLASQWAVFPFKHRNKGLEGLACVYLGDRRYLLGLCEGNQCRGGSKGRRPGGGRIQVFERGGDIWKRVHTLHLPESLRCEDYASLDVSGDRIAVVSQASSLLWIGRFKDSAGNLADPGRVYRFPLNRKQKPCYCNVEGIAWLGSDLILTVSDKRKRGKQPKRCGRKDQSIHIFRIPA
jgi:hypothetical protein